MKSIKNNDNKNEETAADNTKPSVVAHLNLLPCDHYDHEYRQCSSWSGRIDNYYRGVSQSSDACDRLRQLFHDCSMYNRDPASNFDALLRLNDYENELMRRRLEASKANDVWERRDKPPSDWNSPLPDWCKEKLKTTSWYKSSAAATAPSSPSSSSSSS